MSPVDDGAADETVAALGPTVEWVWERIRSLPRSDVPKLLLPMLGFRRLSSAAKRQIVRTLDEDQAFRTTVAETSESANLPALGLLWLRRPEGWEDRFATLLDNERERTEEIERIEGERRLRLDVERLEAALDKALAERDEAKTERDDAVRRLAEFKNTMKAVRKERNEFRGEAKRLELERSRAVNELQAARALADRRLSELRRSRDTASTRFNDSPQSTPPSTVAARALDALEQRRVGTEHAVVEQIDALKTALLGQLERDYAALEKIVPEIVRSDNVGPVAESNTASISRRTPVRLPGGMFDDSVEAAQFLLSAADVWIVDGYNASMARWAQAAVDEQRDWLVQRLERIANHVSVRVIFDGSDGDHYRPPGQRQTRRLSIEFSPVGTEADDVIIDLCATLPIDQRLVVASDDRRVRAGARSNGANLITVHQLFSVSGGV